MGDALKAFECLKVGRGDGRDHYHMWGGHAGQGRNLAGVVHPDLEDGKVGFGRHPGEGQGDPPMVVIAGLGGMGPALGGKGGPQHFLGRCLADRAGDGLILHTGQAVAAVDLQDGRDLAGERVSACLNHTERCCVGAEACVNGQLKVVVRVVASGVRRKAAGRAVLKALVDWQDHNLAGAAQFALHQDAGQIAFGASVVALVIGENFADFLCGFHGL